MQPVPAPVRPTKACLSSLSLPVPDLGVRLHTVDHSLIRKAGDVPALAAQRAAERIVSITDRVWLKVKVSNWRGAVGDLADELPESVTSLDQSWWLCAAGERQGDSSQTDFYAQLKKSAHAGGPNTCSSDFLMPTDWDIERLLAEASVNAQAIMRELVLACAALSLRKSAVQGFSFGDRDVRVRIHVHEDGQAYLVIGATGSLDPTFFVALISCFPGMTAGDWMPEPTETLDIQLAPGEIVWSAMLPVEVQEALLDVDVSEVLY